MPTEASSASADRRAWRWLAAGCEAAAILAWVLFVLRDQYHVAWLQPYEIGLDAMFVGAVAIALVARGVVRSGRAVLYRVGFLVVATTLAVVAAEYVVRVQYRHARSSGNAGDFVAHKEGPPIRVNSLGFREREIPPKTSDRYRIVIVGDSFTWGQGIEEQERYSKLVEQFLGPRYEVFNFGKPGNNMPEHLDVLGQALAVSHDFVLLQIYINDFETRDMERPRPYPLLPEPLGSQLEESSLLYDMLGGQWVRVQELTGISESYAHYMERNLRDPNAPNARRAFGQLHEFFDRAQAAHVAAGAVIFPAIDALGPSGKTYPFGYLHEGVRATCEELKIRCLDLLPLFSTFRDPRALWVSPFDAHPNAMANRRASFEIQQAFAPAWQR